LAYSSKNRYPRKYETPSQNGKHRVYPREDRNLESIPVSIEDTGEYFELSDIPSTIGYGKYGCFISLKNSSAFKYDSDIEFEVKDAANNVIFSDVSQFLPINDSILVYFWIKEDPLRTYGNIQNGIGTLTFVGELDGVPIPFQNKPNYRCVFPIDIRTDLPNISEILFQSSSLINSKLQLSESVELDTADSN